MNPAYDMWAIRKAVKTSDWDEYARLIVRGRRDPPGFPPNIQWAHLLPELRANGFVMLPITFSVEGQEDWFASEKAMPGAHIYSGANDYFRCYPSAYVIRSPLMTLFNEPRVLGLIELYMECWPTLYSVNVWWSDPAPEPQLQHMQRFHRDRDDWRFLTLFAYLTDVTEDNGPHQVILGSHKHNDVGRGEEFDGHCERLYADKIHSVIGAAGTVFLTNTVCLHRGLTPKTRSRLIAWARYGLGPNVNSFDLEQGPLAAARMKNLPQPTKKSRYINRLLVDYDAGPMLEDA